MSSCGGGELRDPTYDTLIQNGEAAELAYQYTINGENGSLNFFPNPNALSSVYLDNFSNSKYNSLQLEVRRRLQNGLQFQVNYVFDDGSATRRGWISCASSRFSTSTTRRSNVRVRPPI